MIKIENFIYSQSSFTRVEPLNPRVLVVTPVRNRPDMVQETIRSVQRQTYRNYVHLVVDDQSTDTTPFILESHAALDPSLRLHRTATRRYAAGAVNDAALPVLETGAFDYVTIIHSDDLLLPGSLERRVALAKATGCRFLYTDQIHLSTGNCVREIAPEPTPTLRAGLLFGGDLTYPSMLWRSDLFTAMGGYDARIRSAEDREMALRSLRELGDELPAVLHEATTIVRHHDGNIREENIRNGNKLAGYMIILSEHYDGLQKIPGALFLGKKLLKSKVKRIGLVDRYMRSRLPGHARLRRAFRRQGNTIERFPLDSLLGQALLSTLDDVSPDGTGAERWLGRP